MFRLTGQYNVCIHKTPKRRSVVEDMAPTELDNQRCVYMINYLRHELDYNTFDADVLT